MHAYRFLFKINNAQFVVLLSGTPAQGGKNIGSVVINPKKKAIMSRFRLIYTINQVWQKKWSLSYAVIQPTGVIV